MPDQPMPRKPRKEPKPLVGQEAFAQRGRDAVLSQAAQLLLFGAQLRGRRLQKERAIPARALAAAPDTQALVIEELDEFPVPIFEPHGAIVQTEEVLLGLKRRFGIADLPKKVELAGKLALQAAADLQEKPSAMKAMGLLETCLRHEEDLVRVSAAAAHFESSAEQARLIDLFAGGTASSDPLAAEIAAMGLARYAPGHPRLAELARPKPSPKGGRRTHSSLIIHGTLIGGDPATTFAWSRPGGDFFDYLSTEVRNDVYGGPDLFDWSGGYSDAARELAANDLVAWIAGQTANHGWSDSLLFAHSYGACVAMRATQLGMKATELVLLSSPVHPQKYFPDFANAGKVVSFHVKMDVVLLADILYTGGGSLRFNDPRIGEEVLPVWFNHSATHSPNVWRKYRLKDKI